MKIMTAIIAASLLSLQGVSVAQESGSQSGQPEPRAEQEPAQGIPATKHQAQTADDIKSERFSELDQDGDHSVSREEAQGEAQLTDNWSTYDENGDGSLDAQEFSEFERTSASGDETTGMLGIGETEQGMPATRHQQQRVGGDLLDQLDKDGDGSVSREEAQGEAGLSGQWDQLDQNGDGKLDSQELDNRQ